MRRRGSGRVPAPVLVAPFGGVDRRPPSNDVWKRHFLGVSLGQIDLRLLAQGQGRRAGQPLGQNLGGALRVGYNMRNDRDVDGFSGLSGGFGIMAGRFRFDYAWVPFGDIGTTHRIGMGFLF